MKTLKSILLGLGLIFCFAQNAFATHLYGAELFYTHISGSNYAITMIIYGDCSGAAFPNLPSSTPEIKIYNGSTLTRTIYLPILSPTSGVEVTPVCPGVTTTCNGGTVSGVTKFVYSDTISLSNSANWKIRATGSLYDPTVTSTGAAMGRSNSITNIVLPSAGSVTGLEATLDNSTQPNSNPVYTTIPTPFFCINVAQEYNQGAVDPNTTDSLAYELVDGIDGTSGWSFVTYLSGYSASAPLACTSGSFSFSNTSGQLTFTPNLAQKSLVVGKVKEYRGGKLVGTSMREMTFIVLSTCSNRSPYGKISDVSGGTAAGNTTVNICKDEPLLKFNINPVDSDGNSILVSVTGLPAGSSLAISGSGTTKPTTAFTWNTSGVAGGSYYFFVTYQDNGCPLSSKQTVAYTINITKPSAKFKVLSKATCARKAWVEIIPNGGVSPWLVDVFLDSAFLHRVTGSGLSLYDSLAPGTYTFALTDSTACFGESVFTVDAPELPEFSFVNSTNTTCYGTATGSISFGGKAGNPPYQYSIDGGAFGSSGAFTGLFGGKHTLRIRDANFCVKDSAFILIEIDSIELKTTTDKPLCRPYRDGSLGVIAVGGKGPYLYAFNDTGGYQSSSFYDSLMSGWYNIKVKDANGCVKTIPVYVEDSIVLRSAITYNDVTCFGGKDGAFTVIPYIGKLPFIFSFDSGAYTSTTVYNALPAKKYIMWVKDGNGCILDTFIRISQPDKLRMEFDYTPPKCFGGSDGSISVKGFGGTGSFSYGIDGGALVETMLFTGLKAGDHKFRIRDVKGCEQDTIVTLQQPSQLKMDLVIQNPVCHGEETGSIKVNGVGGTPPYLYALNAAVPSVIAEFTALKADGYAIIVSDSNGCTKDTGIVLTEPGIIRADSFKVTQPTCEGYADGAVLLYPSGGIEPFQYSVDGINFINTNPITGLKEGTYSIIIKDTNNCTGEVPLTLRGYPKIVLDSFKTQRSSCFGVSDGSLQFFASGGNRPLRYTLENTKDTFATVVFRNLKAKAYTITVIDNTNCFKEFTEFVQQPALLELKSELTQNDCTGPDNGEIKAVVRGGTRPYRYQWSIEGQSDSVVRGLAVGYYMLRVRDANNCSDSSNNEIFYDNCCKPGIPNAFSPNNDGRNDQLRLIYQGGVQLKELSIYNRYGQQVFTSTDINQGWDGKFNGQDLDVGVYYYYVRIRCGNNMDHDVDFKGDITLVR